MGEKNKTTEILLKLVTRARQRDQMFLQHRLLCVKTAGQAGPRYSWHPQFRGFHNVFWGGFSFSDSDDEGGWCVFRADVMGLRYRRGDPVPWPVSGALLCGHQIR